MEFAASQPENQWTNEVISRRNLFARLDALLEESAPSRPKIIIDQRSINLNLPNGHALSIDRDRSFLNYLYRGGIYRASSDSELQLSPRCVIGKGESVEFDFDPEIGEIVGFSHTLGPTEAAALTLLIEQAIKERAEAA